MATMNNTYCKEDPETWETYRGVMCTTRVTKTNVATSTSQEGNGGNQLQRKADFIFSSCSIIRNRNKTGDFTILQDLLYVEDEFEENDQLMIYSHIMIIMIMVVMMMMNRKNNKVE
jgi:hypothetical protein